jgi:dihydrofolate reductase
MRVVVNNNLTLDGVMQAAGRPDEDLRGGFEHGGWALPYNDPVMGRVMGERMAQGGPLLLGRRTYEDFAGFWPNQADNPFTEVLNNVRKYVASRTLEEPLWWSNSTLLEGDAAKAVARLKEQPGRDLVLLGSGELVQSLRRANVLTSGRHKTIRQDSAKAGGRLSLQGTRFSDDTMADRSWSLPRLADRLTLPALT